MHTLQQVDVFTNTRDILAQPRRSAMRRNTGLVHLRHRRAPRRERVVDGDRRNMSRIRLFANRQCTSSANASGRPLRPEWRSRPALPERRRPHTASGRRRERMTETGVHRDVVLTRRAMDARHRLHGRIPDADAAPRHASAARDGGLARRAYNRWLIERVLSADDRIKTLTTFRSTRQGGRADVKDSATRRA